MSVHQRLVSPDIENDHHCGSQLIVQWVIYGFVHSSYDNLLPEGVVGTLINLKGKKSGKQNTVNTTCDAWAVKVLCFGVRLRINSFKNTFYTLVIGQFNGSTWLLKCSIAAPVCAAQCFPVLLFYTLQMWTSKCKSQRCSVPEVHMVLIIFHDSILSFTLPLIIETEISPFINSLLYTISFLKIKFLEKDC